VAGAIEWGALSDEVSPVLEVAHPFVEVPPFQVVVDASELLVFSFNFGDNGTSVGFELGTLLMVVVIVFGLGRGGEVHHTDHYSQGEEWGSVALEELFTLVWHGIDVPR